MSRRRRSRAVDVIARKNARCSSIPPLPRRSSAARSISGVFVRCSVLAEVSRAKQCSRTANDGGGMLVRFPGRRPSRTASLLYHAGCAADVLDEAFFCRPSSARGQTRYVNNSSPRWRRRQRPSDLLRRLPQQHTRRPRRQRRRSPRPRPARAHLPRAWSRLQSFTPAVTVSREFVATSSRRAGLSHVIPTASSGSASRGLRRTLRDSPASRGCRVSAARCARRESTSATSHGRCARSRARWGTPRVCRPSASCAARLRSICTTSRVRHGWRFDARTSRGAAAPPAPARRTSVRAHAAHDRRYSAVSV